MLMGWFSVGVGGLMWLFWFNTTFVVFPLHVLGLGSLSGKLLVDYWMVLWAFFSGFLCDGDGKAQWSEHSLSPS